jgi:hypothetical protein
MTVFPVMASIISAKELGEYAVEKYELNKDYDESKEITEGIFY